MSKRKDMSNIKLFIQFLQYYGHFSIKKLQSIRKATNPKEREH